MSDRAAFRTLREGAPRRRFELTDEQSHRIEHLLPGQATDPGATARDHRLFLDAILGIARTGAPGPDLPDRFGQHDTAYQGR